MRQKYRQTETTAAFGNAVSSYQSLIDVFDSNYHSGVRAGTNSGIPCTKCASLCAKTCICAFLCLAFWPAISAAQGSIFGNVKNADLSIPTNGSVSFFGYINDSDAEIRTELSIGAGYDNGNWFDDFQNYLSESAGQPYAYHFRDTQNNEGSVLNGAIPNNSFQQENISMSQVAWPQQPTGLTITAANAIAVNLRWDYDPALIYHVYRRPSTSAGSFFRIDNPSGILTGSAVTDSVFVDTAVDGVTEFNYLIIAENSAGAYSQHSDISVSAPSSCCQLAGDGNQDGRQNIVDITFLVAFIFTGGSAPICFDQADANGDNRVNIVDVTYFVAWMFTGGSAPVCGSTGTLQPSIYNTNDSFTGSS